MGPWRAAGGMAAEGAEKGGAGGRSPHCDGWFVRETWSDLAVVVGVDLRRMLRSGELGLGAT